MAPPMKPPAPAIKTRSFSFTNKPPSCDSRAARISKRYACPRKANGSRKTGRFRHLAILKFHARGLTCERRYPVLQHGELPAGNDRERARAGLPEDRVHRNGRRLDRRQRRAA